MCFEEGGKHAALKAFLEIIFVYIYILNGTYT